jgi:hypothetical protein
VVYDGIFFTLVFQIPATMSGRFGSEFTQTQLSFICNSWTTCRCSPKTVQGDTDMHFIAIFLGPLSTAATNRPIVPAAGDYDGGEIGGIIGRGN